MLKLELPYPPSVNRYWRRSGHRIHISRGGAMYRDAVVAILLAGEVELQRGRLAVAVEVFPPDARRRDLDNVLKALLDALKHGGAYEDDSQIDFLSVRRGEVVRGGLTKVQIMDVGAGE